MAGQFELVVLWESGREVTVRVDVEAFVAGGLDEGESAQRRARVGPRYLFDDEELESESALRASLCRWTRGPGEGEFVQSVCYEGDPLSRLLGLLELEAVPVRPHRVEAGCGG